MNSFLLGGRNYLPDLRNQVLLILCIFPPVKQQGGQFFFHLLIIQRRGPFFGHDDQVPGGQLLLVAAKKFPQQAFHPVAPHRFSQAPGHRQPQAGRAGGPWPHNDAEVGRVEPPALGLGPEEIGPSADPIRFGKTGSPFGGGGVGRAPVGGCRGPAQEAPTLRPRGGSGPWPDGASKPGGRPCCSSAPKSRGFGPGANYEVDTCVSTFTYPYSQIIFQPFYKPFIQAFVKGGAEILRLCPFPRPHVVPASPLLTRAGRASQDF